MGRAAASAPDFGAQRQVAAALPGATADVKWGANLVYSVGCKMFCIFLPHDSAPLVCSFKVDADRFLELTGVPGVAPAPYLARAHWVKVTLGHQLHLDDLDALIRRSHALVAAKLTKKLQTELGLAP